MCLTSVHRQAELIAQWNLEHENIIKDAAIKSETVSALFHSVMTVFLLIKPGPQWRSWTDWTGSEQIPGVALRGRALTVSLPPDSGGIVPLCVRWDWTCSCMLLIDCPLKLSFFFSFSFFLPSPWCDNHEMLCFVVAVQNIPLQYIKISLHSAPCGLQHPQQPPHSRPTTPRNTHTFHKTCHTSAAQSGVMLDSVNSPDGELNKSYNAT